MVADHLNLPTPNLETFPKKKQRSRKKKGERKYKKKEERRKSRFQPGPNSKNLQVFGWPQFRFNLRNQFLGISRIQGSGLVLDFLISRPDPREYLVLGLAGNDLTGNSQFVIFSRILEPGPRIQNQPGGQDS